MKKTAINNKATIKQKTNSNNSNKISLCIIIKNEERWIKNSISPIKEIIDEIIVVDTGSKDKSIGIAKNEGAEVIRIRWEDDFSKARNEALKNAKMPWILMIDADETISKRDVNKIKEAIQTTDKDTTAFTFIIREYTNNSNESINPCFVSARTDYYPESQSFKGWIEKKVIRLFKNDPKIRFEGKVNETIENAIKKNKGKIKEIKIPIHHFLNMRYPEEIEYINALKERLEKS